MTPRDLAGPLARLCRARPVVIGISGAQGSGKSTLAAALAADLSGAGCRTAVLSLDDLYLGRAARQRLAAAVHPLFATRGVPGTHDVAAGLALVDRLRGGSGRVAVPRFDKAADEPGPTETVIAPVDVLIFEGWCLGATPQTEAALAAPVNTLEAEADGDGRWRRAVNRALAETYQPLWDRIDLLVELRAPDWSVVAGWRAEQEARLGDRAMAPAALTRFVAHYERLTRHMLTGGIARRGRPADAVAMLDESRCVVGLSGLG